LHIRSQPGLYSSCHREHSLASGAGGRIDKKESAYSEHFADKVLLTRRKIFYYVRDVLKVNDLIIMVFHQKFEDVELRK